MPRRLVKPTTLASVYCSRDAGFLTSSTVLDASSCMSWMAIGREQRDGPLAHCSLNNSERLVANPFLPMTHLVPFLVQLAASASLTLILQGALPKDLLHPVGQLMQHL